LLKAVCEVLATLLGRSLLAAVTMTASFELRFQRFHYFFHFLWFQLIEFYRFNSFNTLRANFQYAVGQLYPQFGSQSENFF
jgi:hypothetical protein